ncbi:hypothetical protein IFR05_014277 [Cadophora sp. M221]|nr:hypothetical protein IFR05_014277 [Cadophora sp. M221]
MTERPISISTQNATPIQTAFPSTAVNSATDARPVIEPVEEEPYTIKCICDYLDDDGNTIYCEKCDTWQHIECFYPGQVDDASREEFDHSCADCKPRPLTLDRRHATERQRLQRQNKAINDSPDKKTKRPPSKSHKKKAKPSDLQVNGHHDHDHHKHASPSEHHLHTKKSKGHRSTQSVSSQMKRSPPLNARPHNHAHPPSPAHTPPEIGGNSNGYTYNDRFVTLYDGDESRTTSTNSYASLLVSNLMGIWLQSPEKLKEDANAIKKNVFQILTVPVDNLQWPHLRIDTEKVSQRDGPTLTWRSVRNTAPLTEAGRICPIYGVIKFQVDYCADPQSRWAEAAHPQPFVIFHPQLPLVIDMRQEGSEYRYVRRSCQPNTALETFLAHDTEYHFWLTSDRPLAANEQVTIQWDFRFPNNELGNRYKRLLSLGEEEGAVSDNSDVTDDEYETLSSLVYTVLSDHGGCACARGSECAFVRFQRDYHGRSHPQTNGAKPKKGRKAKQNHVSPTSTGHATNSRAASEGQGDQYEDDDNRSVSGSVRSKPHSRDMTPSHNGESNGILTESSEREKRKLAALEDSFRKMEQQGQPPRKKKRASDGSNMSISSHTAGPHSTPKPRQRSVAPRPSISQPSGPPATNGARSHKYVDASTASRRPSGSPVSTASPTGAVRSPDTRASPTHSVPYRSWHASVNPKPTYAEASTQTDEVQNAWWNDSTPKPKRSILTLSKRLLRNRHNIQKQQEARATQQPAPSNGGEDGSVRASPAVSMDLDPPHHEDRHQTQSPTETKGRNMSIASSTPSVDVSGSVDVAMTDAPAVPSTTTIKPPPPPWPSQSNSAVGSGQKSPVLRVQMPPAPIFSTPNMSAPLSGTGTATPSSASSTAQSPFGTGQFPPPLAATVVNGIAPSPIKTTKKLSLSDYAARRKKTDTTNTTKPTAGSSPTITPAVLKPSLSTIEEAKGQGGLEGSAMVESPAAVEKTVNPLAVAGPTSEPLPSTLLSEKSNGTL